MSRGTCRRTSRSRQSGPEPVERAEPSDRFSNLSEQVASHLAPPSRVSSEVGVPKAEALLTQALLANAAQVLQPGPGRVLLPLTEVELGRGRPDVLLVVVSPGGLRGRAAHGLRLHNLTEARVLAGAIEGYEGHHSRGHERSVQARLHERGWLKKDGTPYAWPDLPVESTLLEAKVKDWRSGVAQLSRNRWVSNRSALVLPESRARNVPQALVRHNGIGILVVDEVGGTSWRVRPSRRPLPLVARLWLAELGLRQLEG
jgi:hypothetical protein